MSKLEILIKVDLPDELGNDLNEVLAKEAKEAVDAKLREEMTAYYSNSSWSTTS